MHLPRKYSTNGKTAKCKRDLQFENINYKLEPSHLHHFLHLSYYYTYYSGALWGVWCRVLGDGPSQINFFFPFLLLGSGGTLSNLATLKREVYFLDFGTVGGLVLLEWPGGKGTPWEDQGKEE